MQSSYVFEKKAEWCCCETAINSKISGQLGTMSQVFLK
jgi:hypothetical protein